GPAGALAAYELGRWGLGVLLVDKMAFPRWKVCGCCLNGCALATLTAAGLGHLPERLGATPLHSLWLAGGGRHARVPLTREVAVSREALDAALVEAAVGAGAAFLPQTQVTLGPAGPAARGVRLHQGGRNVEAAGRVILAADGLGGRLVLGRGHEDGYVEPGAWIGAGGTAPAAAGFFRSSAIFIAGGRGGCVGFGPPGDG